MPWLARTHHHLSYETPSFPLQTDSPGSSWPRVFRRQPLVPAALFFLLCGQCPLLASVLCAGQHRPAGAAALRHAGDDGGHGAVDPGPHARPRPCCWITFRSWPPAPAPHVLLVRCMLRAFWASWPSRPWWTAGASPRSTVDGTPATAQMASDPSFQKPSWTATVLSAAAVAAVLVRAGLTGDWHGVPPVKALFFQPDGLQCATWACAGVPVHLAGHWRAGALVISIISPLLGLGRRRSLLMALL